MEKYFREKIATQQHYIEANAAQIAARLQAIVNVPHEPQLIVQFIASDASVAEINIFRQRCERIYGQQGAHVLLVDCSVGNHFSPELITLLITLHAVWNRRGCFFGVTCGNARRSVLCLQGSTDLPVFSTTAEAEAYLALACMQDSECQE